LVVRDLRIRVLPDPPRREVCGVHDGIEPVGVEVDNVDLVTGRGQTALGSLATGADDDLPALRAGVGHLIENFDPRR